MIARISGLGQFELHDASEARLRELDTEISAAIHAHEESRFHQLLHELIQYVRQNGTPVPHDTIVPSSVIIPPEDISLEEAQRFFTDEGLLEPVQA